MEIRWNKSRVIAKVNDVCEKSCERGARIIAGKMRQKVPRRSGKLARTIKVKKSKYRNGGYIVGVFHQDSGVWEETLGARAIFVEYGHAAPYKGRKYVGRKNVVKAVARHSFMRPALKGSKQKIKRLFVNKLK